VLVSSVECVAQVHDECIALPSQVVLDVRVREASPVKQVCFCDTDRMAGPCEEVIVPMPYVKDFVGDMPEEGDDLNGGDYSKESCHWVTKHQSRGGPVVCRGAMRIVRC
jgi:hypothetical protein